MSMTIGGKMNNSGTMTAAVSGPNVTPQRRRQYRPLNLQMDLPFLPPTALGHALASYLAHRGEGLAEATLSDYNDRVKWLNMVLGETAPIESITYLRLERLAREHGIRSSPDGLLDVSIRKRLTFLRGALGYAVKCGYLDRNLIPDMPRLKDDGRARRSFHTLDQWREFRQRLAPGPLRRFCDLGMWTGHHTHDLQTVEWWMLDPEKPILNEDGEQVGTGMFLRRNHKNKRCEPVWFPMEPELRAIVQGWYAEGASLATDGLVCGRIWAKHKSFAIAAERASVPYVSPIDLRRSYATTLVGRGYSHEYVRQALGHEGETSLTAGGVIGKPTVASRHYMVAGPSLWSGWAKLHGSSSPANDTK